LPRAWLSLDRQDCDPRVLIEDLANAVRSAFPDALEPLFAQLASRGNASPDALLDQFVALVGAEVDELFVLAVDDAHVLDGSPSVALLERLLAGTPLSMRILLLTRAWSAFPSLARMASERTAFALLEGDLAFTDSEAKQFLRNVGVRAASARDALVGKAAGWAAALGVLAEHRDVHGASNPT